MKLYINQKLFSLGQNFDVLDEYGESKYHVRGELFSFGRKLHVLDCNECEVAFVQQRMMTFLPKFDVFVGDSHVATIEKEISFIRASYKISESSVRVVGDLFHYDYDILDDGQPVAHIHKKLMSWGDSFELDCEEGSDVLLSLAIVLAIDTCMDADQYRR